MLRLTVHVLVFALFLLTPHSPAFAQSPEKELVGEGATFPQPFYVRAFEAYYRASGVRVHYRGVGSAEGIRALLEKKADFAGTDVYMTEKELQRAGVPILHVPTCLGAVVITYNLPGNPALNFNAELLSDLFLGKITNWKDPRIAALNPDARLPDLPVTVVHRSDGSGTTFIFSEYMTRVNKEWRDRAGTGRIISWPVGRGAKGNSGVAGVIRQIPGSVGYVELIYAKGNDMTVAKVKNRSGRFVEPGTQSVSLAAADLREDGRFSITDTGAADGYPISGFTWIILYLEQSHDGRGRERAEELARLLWWLTHDGQKHATALHYAPLPGPAVLHAEEAIRSITFRGIPVLKEETRRKR